MPDPRGYRSSGVYARPNAGAQYFGSVVEDLPTLSTVQKPPSSQLNAMKESSSMAAAVRSRSGCGAGVKHDARRPAASRAQQFRSLCAHEGFGRQVSVLMEQPMACIESALFRALPSAPQARRSLNLIVTSSVILSPAPAEPATATSPRKASVAASRFIIVI